MDEAINVSNPIKRIRWATQRVTGNKERRKRRSILNRFHRRAGSTEKKTDSIDGSRAEAVQDGVEAPDKGAEQGGSRRRIFFNIPLSDDAKDENGHPLADFGRNKVRTAKYTPLSFVPKDLWFQFHNIANVYFLFVIILAVGPAEYIASNGVRTLTENADIPNFRRFESCSWRCSVNLYSVRHRGERCCRGLAQNRFRQ